MTVRAVVFANRDNFITVRLLSGGLAQNLASITRMTLWFNNRLLDSDQNPEIFDWTTDGSEGLVHLKLGSVLTDPTVNGYAPAELTVYDSSYPLGITWEQSCEVPNLLIRVCD